MDELSVSSLEITNFKVFQNIKIEKLGRVNLIVGKNSVGKSTLLEAIWLYINQGSLNSIFDILRTSLPLPRRTLSSNRDNRDELDQSTLSALQLLYNGRFSIPVVDMDSPVTFEVKQLNKSDNLLSVSTGWHNQDSTKDAKIYYRQEQPSLFGMLGILVSYGNQRPVIYPLESSGLRQIITREEYINTNNNFISTSGLDVSIINDLWAKVALTSLEDEVVNTLKILFPDLERVSIVNDSRLRTLSSIIVKLRDLSSPVPIRTLGDGLSRVFGMILALVNSKSGILLIDEFENGLHYSVQLDLWRLILKVAKDLNIQIFATTHSWDCIKAFQQATMEDQESEGMLISLRNKKQGLVSVLFDERRLAIATQDDIEVR